MHSSRKEGVADTPLSTSIARSKLRQQQVPVHLQATTLRREQTTRLAARQVVAVVPESQRTRQHITILDKEKKVKIKNSSNFRFSSRLLQQLYTILWNLRTLLLCFRGTWNTMSWRKRE